LNISFPKQKIKILEDSLLFLSEIYLFIYFIRRKIVFEFFKDFWKNNKISVEAAKV
jgi:hypothetical protein